MEPKFESMRCAFSDLVLISALVSYDNEMHKIAGWSYMIGVALALLDPESMQLQVPERQP